MIHGGGEKKKMAITGLLSRRKKPAGGYFISSVGQRQNDAFREKKKRSFFPPHPHFKLPAGDFPPARSSDSRCGNARSYLCRRDGVWIGLGLFCTVKEQMSHAGASVQNRQRLDKRGDVVHPITHPSESVCVHDSMTL